MGAPTVFSSIVPSFFDDDLDFGGGRRGIPSPRNLLRDAEKTFRQLDRLVNTVGGDVLLVSRKHLMQPWLLCGGIWDLWTFSWVTEFAQTSQKRKHSWLPIKPTAASSENCRGRMRHLIKLACIALDASSPDKKLAVCIAAGWSPPSPAWKPTASQTNWGRQPDCRCRRSGHKAQRLRDEAPPFFRVSGRLFFIPFFFLRKLSSKFVLGTLRVWWRGVRRWKETDHGFLLTCATPGLKKEDLAVEIVDSPKGRGHFLVISGESKHSEHHHDDKHTNSFFATYKKFEERIRLPEGVDKNTLTAKYEDGMLQVHVKFPEEEKMDRKKIAIS